MAVSLRAFGASVLVLALGAAEAPGAADVGLLSSDSRQKSTVATEAAPQSLESALADESNIALCGCDSCCGDDCCEDACCGDDSCCSDDCCEDSCCGKALRDACCDPVWTVNAGAVILSRARPDFRPIVIPTAGPGLISGGSEFGFGWAAGPDISVARRTARGNSIQVRYFGALDWDANAAYGAVGNVRIGSFSNFGATNLTSLYNSSLHSTEVNWLHPMSERVTFLSGFRWIELADDLHYNITFPAFTADYNWNTNNHLYGSQVGANLRLWNLTGPLSINGAFKGGIYGNVADNDFTLRPSTGGQFDGGGRGSRVAFAGEIDLTSSYQVTKHLALTGGYQLLWIDHVALASDQGAASTAASTQAVFDGTGDIFYHGAMTSATFTW